MLSNQLFGSGYVRLLSKIQYAIQPAIQAVHLRHYIAVFRRGIRGRNAHEHEFDSISLHDLNHAAYCMEVFKLGVRVTGHHYHNLVITAPLFVFQIGACKGYGRESVAAFGFGDHVNVFAEMIDDGVTLRYARSYRNRICDA